MVENFIEAENGELFLEQLKEVSPDIVFMDISMPYMDGIETSRKALEINKDLKIIAMTSDGSIQTVSAMLNAGAQGYLLKDIDFDELKSALKSLINGESFFSKNILLKLAESPNKLMEESKREHLINMLSPRETEVLQLLCRGKNVQEIADTLFLSERTIEKHKSNLFQKTKTQNTVNLVLWALHHKFFDISAYDYGKNNTKS